MRNSFIKSKKIQKSSSEPKKKNTDKLKKKHFPGRVLSINFGNKDLRNSNFLYLMSLIGLILKLGDKIHV